MLSREHRFHGHNSVRTAYARGQVVRGQSFSLRYSRNERRQTYRAAVVVSRKVSKSAVVRNRLRRRLYEQIRLSTKSLNSSYDLVWIVFDTGLLSLSGQQLANEVHGLLAKAAIKSSDNSREDTSVL